MKAHPSEVHSSGPGALVGVGRLLPHKLLHPEEKHRIHQVPSLQLTYPHFLPVVLLTSCRLVCGAITPLSPFKCQVIHFSHPVISCTQIVSVCVWNSNSIARFLFFFLSKTMLVLKRFGFFSSYFCCETMRVTNRTTERKETISSIW